MNYEDVLENILWDALKYKFCIEDDKKIFQYLKLRYFIIHNKKEVTNIKDFFCFIFNELNIENFNYKKETLKFIGSENNLNNVYSNWNFHYNLPLNKNLLLEVEKYANSKTSKLKNDKEYNNLKIYFKLEKLNELFDIKLNKVKKLDGFTQNENIFILEKKLKQNLNIENETTAFISETDLEDYLIEHLEDIEDGLKYLTRQYILDEGRIDILAKDKEDNIVIIEVKIDIDKKICWQCLYYPTQIKKRYPNKNIRMIVIMKEYPNYLLEPLNKLDIEKFKYDIKVKNMKIKKIEIRKV